MMPIHHAWSCGRPAKIAWVLAAVAAAAISQSPLPFSPLQMPILGNVLGQPFGFGDVNGDGSPDLIVAGAPYVVLNDGHGQFTPAVGSAGFSPSPGLPGPPPPFAIADFNQDGRDDLVVALALYLGTPAGTLTFSGTLPPLVGPPNVCAGDVDGDGAPDLVCGFSAGSVVQPTHVLHNDGTGSFTDVGDLGLGLVGWGSAMAFVDFDLDGDQDLAASNHLGTVAIAVNNGGTFTWQSAYGGTSIPSSLVKARLNGDAYPDLVWWRNGSAPLFYLGGPSGMTPSGTTLSTPVQNLIRPVAVFDVTGDGIDEILMAFDSGIAIWSIGNPGPAVFFSNLGGPSGTLLSTNLDGDADVDLLARTGLAYVAHFADGTGGFHTQGSSFEPRLLLGGPVAIDLSGDGAPELVGLVEHAGMVKLAVAQNDGTGGFVWTTIPIAGSAPPNVPSYVSAADIDGDGQKDLAVLELVYNYGFWTISLRAIMNGGGGLWTAGPATTIGGSTRCDVAVADLNGDGRDDLVFCERVLSGGVRVLYSTGSGFSTPGISISGISQPNRITLFDADGDLDLDVAIASGGGAEFVLNNNNGTFTSNYGPAVSATFVTAGDVDGDGTVDLYLDNRLYLHQGASWVFSSMVPLAPYPFNAVETRAFDFDFDFDVDTVTGAGFAYVAEAPGVLSTHALPMTCDPGTPWGSRWQPVDLDRDGDLDLLGVRPVENQPVYGFTRPQMVLFNTARQLGQNSPARPGRPLSMTLHGAPGGQWILYGSSAPVSIALPPFGTVFIDPVGAIQLGAGVIPPTGTGVASIDVPSSASSYLGITFELQGLVNTLAGLRLTNARHVTLVSF